MMSGIPVANMILPQRANEETKDVILSSAKVAVKQIQSYYSVCGPDYVPSLGANQVHQLCDSLDRTLFYGLRECQQGYWPFVKQFTHKNTVKFIEALSNLPTQIQRGRAWLCLALNENSLESYFRSFQENPKLVRKHYLSLAILQDDQRMQLLLMLIAGLENIPICIDFDQISLGTGLEFISNFHGINRTYESGSDVIQYGHFGSSSQDSSQDSDAGITEGYESDEIEPNLNRTSDHPESRELTVQADVHCNLSPREIEQITKYINMSSQDGVADNTDLEVIRTKVVRRVKKSPVHNRNVQQDCDADFGCTEKSDDSMSPETSNTKENRLSKATMDSGVCLESQCSSGRDSPELNCQFGKREMSFDVGDFQPELNVTFSTPVKRREADHCNDPHAPETKLLHEERGVPEGQEDPVNNHCSQTSASRQPLLPGDDGLEEEHISFYDLCKVHYMKCVDQPAASLSPDNETTEDVASIQSTISEEENDLESENVVAEKPQEEDLVAKELALLSACQTEERLDFSVDSNTLLYLLVEVYESEEEEFFKMFYGYLKEGGFMVLFLLTNKAAYILKPGGIRSKFICCQSAKYSDIELVTVILNYQGFVIERKDKRKLSIYTADENLTRSILSNMEVAIRRSSPKVPLPGFATDATMQIRRLKNYFGSELRCGFDDVFIQHFVMVRWEDFDGSSSPLITPAGPKREGTLLYRFRHSNSARNDDTWYSGCFILKGGFLYCMEEYNKAAPLFHIQICDPHCKGYRRLHLPERPYAFEVILDSDDYLQLAAADADEASHWLHSFLVLFSLNGQFADVEEKHSTSCFVAICNNAVIVARHLSSPFMAKASLCNLTAVFSDSAVPNSVLLEFEIVEASAGCGEWIITFDSEIEKEKFLDVIRNEWFKLFRTELFLSPIKDVALIKKMRETFESVSFERKILRDLCSES